MEQIEQLSIDCKDSAQIKAVLDNFNAKNADLFNFNKLQANDHWHILWRAVFAFLKDSQLASLHPICLNTVRILTRDEFSLQTHDIVDDMNCLLTLAHLTGRSEISGGQLLETIAMEEGGAASAAEIPNASQTVVEALKCLCNLVFQNVECRRYCVKKNALDAIIKRVASPTPHPCAIELYDMKLLFLVTALEPAARSRVQLDLNGLAYMTEWLDEKLHDAVRSDEERDLLCEMLKVMFNITTSPDKSPSENEIQSLHLAGVVRELLLHFGPMSSERERNVVTHAINLLTNLSSACLTELMGKCEPMEGAEETSKLLIYEGRNLRVLDIFLRYLHSSMDEQESSAASSELIPPVLTVLVKCARGHRTMRHYIRSRVLPPLRDVSQRPEVGNELRNHLSRFLTLPATVVRDLSAELLFICCKENVGRMIKYTGYGNAAGLFANRGLLDCRRVEHNEYSSDSEDSDTEEYKQLQHAINPVLGCYEPPKRNPLEGMSDEQKEYEAMQLVQLMEQLHRSGVVQPCRIGEDGKPQPVDHILQLQEELPQQQLEQKRKT